MEKARVDGTTVEVLTNAFRLNETLLRDISALRLILADEKNEEAQAQSRLRNYQREGEEGLLNNFLRMFGADVVESESVYYSQSRLESVKDKIQKCQTTINEKEAQRNSKLEDGELTILRTVDATEGGLTDQILKTATDSLTLIKSTRVSIERLLNANARSRAACTEITATLNRMAGGETILKGAL